MSQTFTVTGMTCQHCVASVTEEVEAVVGVESVQVDLDTGRVVVVGADVSEADVLAAVREAGYSGARS